MQTECPFIQNTHPLSAYHQLFDLYISIPIPNFTGIILDQINNCTLQYKINKGKRLSTGSVSEFARSSGRYHNTKKIAVGKRDKNSITREGKDEAKWR